MKTFMIICALLIPSLALAKGGGGGGGGGGHGGGGGGHGSGGGAHGIPTPHATPEGHATPHAVPIPVRPRFIPMPGANIYPGWHFWRPTCDEKHPTDCRR